MKTHKLKIIFLLSMGFILADNLSFAGMGDYSAVPPFVLRGTDANVLLNLSIESPMQGAAYNDQPNDANGDGDTSDTLDCAGRDGSLGVCYIKEKEFLGIFDPDKCYVYSSSRFEPSSDANSDHECSGKWSGNFLNWATMTAIDEFRWALTGGNRVVDTTSLTVLERANMGLGAGHSWYPYKKVTASKNVAPSTVTPYSDGTIYIYNHGYQFNVGTSAGGSQKASNLYVRVKVCDPSKGLEDNCVDYGGYYKPDGLIQNKADKLRFALMGYSKDSSRDRDGGILRANMKYVGPKQPDGTDNPIKEFGTDGIFITNPEGAAEGVSGVIMYLNKFGANGYKGCDPVGELFYECLNYYKDRGPTAEYSAGLTAAEKDGYPVVTAWDDPIQYWCQKNYIVGINDANPWLDKQLPGTYFTTGTFNGRNINDSGSGYDWGEPSNPDPDINVTTLTNTVGDLEGLTNTSQYVGCTETNCDMANTTKNIAGLGEVMATFPDPIKENSYYVAGLAYYANTQDIRSDFANRQTVTTFMIDTQEYKATPPIGQMNMLYLTGKYGGFEETDFTDTNSDGNAYEPNLASEWDADSDGEPDYYILATDPKKLVDGLGKAFNEIMKRASSGTAASVISNSRSGEGAVYQSIFYPYYNDTCATANEVKWIGEVHALFVDSYGNMREDTAPQNSTLDLTTDKIIVFDGSDVYKLTDTDGSGELDAGSEFTDTNGNGKLDSAELTGTPVTLNDIEYVWSSSTWLNDTALVADTQRTYATTDKKRYIFTFIDDGDMVKEAGEQVEFTTAAGDVTKIYPYIHLFTPFAYTVASPPPGITALDNTYKGYQTERIIKYIRGEDQGAFSYGSSIIPAMRSRQIDFGCDNTVETWRMGDVIHSTPTLVGGPAEGYDMIYKDTTYENFVKKYKNRRGVVYVGSNDGMLHAFNAGFFDSTNHKFITQPLKDNPSPPPDEILDTSYTAYDLGAELWAYIPFNLLPHLYWLTDPTYSHVYYVDLKPKIFDARIYDHTLGANDVHPNGWATILVCGMRFGGGAIRTDKDKDGVYEPAHATLPDQEMRSAYIIMDITDPESAPILLGEVTFSDLGYTTSYPSAILMDPKDTVSGNDWYLTLGSGPIDSGGPNTTALEDCASDQQAKIYIIDLKELAQNAVLQDPVAAALPAAGAFATLSDANSYVSESVSVDFDLDYKTDAVYFSTISGSHPTWGGKLRRIVIDDDMTPANWDGDSTLVDVSQPITSPPAIARDSDERIWVCFGTGRFLNHDDITNNVQQSFYSIKEPFNDINSDGIVDTGEGLTYGTVLTTILLDVSNAVVYENGNTVTGVAGVTNFTELETAIEGKDGWLLDFSSSYERNLGGAALIGDILTFTSYTPDSDPCEFEGASALYALYFRTGTAYIQSVIGLGSGFVTNGAETEYEVSKRISLGDGLTVTPNIHTGRQGGAKAFIQTSTGAIESVEQINPGVTKTGKVSWHEEE